MSLITKPGDVLSIALSLIDAPRKEQFEKNQQYIDKTLVSFFFTWPSWFLLLEICVINCLCETFEGMPAQLAKTPVASEK